MVYIYAGVFIDIFEFHLASEGGGKMSITRHLAKNALEKQQENQSSSQSNVVDDHESLSDENESYLGRNGNSS